MQQRTGIRAGGRRTASHQDISVLYYVFDLLYLDGCDLRRVSLESEKTCWRKLPAWMAPSATPIISSGRGAVRCG